ncbi:MAG: isoprenylcysteine carboxylmethyltransferase family protein [Candidatus Omnitrophica bacterium]|nr:isoprenylcysteine carboxylmethyltransferase family protein [Candidatus Omnitrophota bacterium]
MKKRLKINGVIMIIVLLGISVFPDFFLRRGKMELWDEFFEVLGITCILLGQLFRASARGYKSEYSLRGHALIRSGPYAFVRNPMYLGILLIGSGIVLMLFKWWVAALFLIGFVIRYIFLIFSEEKKLLVLFPAEFPEYKRSVPRIFPSLRILFERDINEYLPMKFIWLRREMGAIFAVLFITLLVESWDDVMMNGITSYLGETAGILITFFLFTGLIIYLGRSTLVLEKNGSSKGKSNSELQDEKELFPSGI